MFVEIAVDGSAKTSYDNTRIVSRVDLGD
jgi:hypothetical protein